MALKIKPKNRYSTGLPDPSALDTGELWINSVDKKIGIKDNQDQVIVLADLTKETADNLYLGTDDNAVSATKLQNARTVDGIAFDGTANIHHYAVSSSAVDAAEKAVELTGFTKAVGAFIIITFTNGNSAANPTLNVGETGAATIINAGQALGNITAGTTLMLVFDGTNYQVVGGTGGSMDLSAYYTKEEMDAKFLPIMKPTAKGIVSIYSQDEPGAQSYVEAYNAAKESSSQSTGMLNAYTKEEADALFAQIMNPVIIDTLTIEDDTGETQTLSTKE